MPKNTVPVAGDEGRHYRIPGTTRTVPSVTTILGAYPKPWLGPWAAKMVAEYVWEHWSELNTVMRFGNDEQRADVFKAVKRAPWDKRDAAADHGTDVHSALEGMAAGLPFTVPPELEEHVEQLRRWNAAFRPEVVWSEKQAYSTYDGWAGTFDLAARVMCHDHGRPCLFLIDLKTSKEPSVGSWSLQLAAYGHAELIADGEDILDRKSGDLWPDHCAVLWVPRERPGQWQFIEVPVTSRTYEAFLAVKAVYEYDRAKHDGQLILPFPEETAA